MATRTATEQGRRTADLPPELFIHWIHSREEDQDDIQFFRTEGFSFPPSFGRDGMEIRPDGSSSPSTGASRSSDRFPAASDCPRWRRTR